MIMPSSKSMKKMAKKRKQPTTMKAAPLPTARRTKTRRRTRAKNNKRMMTRRMQNKSKKLKLLPIKIMQKLTLKPKWKRRPRKNELFSQLQHNKRLLKQLKQRESDKRKKHPNKLRSMLKHKE